MLEPDARIVHVERMFLPDPTPDNHIETRFEATETCTRMVIGRDCWIGHGAIVLPGAQLGNGGIVGTGAVAGGTVPDYAIVSGNPAPVLRLRFGAETIAALLELAQ